MWKMEEGLGFFCVVPRDRIRTRGWKLQRDRFVPTIRELSNSQSCENGVGSLRKQQRVPRRWQCWAEEEWPLIGIAAEESQLWLDLRQGSLLALRLSDSLHTAQSISIWTWNMAPALRNSILAPLVALLPFVTLSTLQQMKVWNKRLKTRATI